MAVKAMQSQKNQAVPELSESEAREHLEKLRWPNGPVCPHCGGIKSTRLEGTSSRPGLIQCNDCRKQFTVTLGTVLEDSHISLAKWIKGFHLMCSSKKGISALQLQRNLGLGSYKTAWHMAHRIRWAMKHDMPMLLGTVEVDESYIGGKPRPGDGKIHKRGRGTSKAPIMVLVERDGSARCKPVDKVDAKNLKGAIIESVDPSAAIHTDELAAYNGIGTSFVGGHYTVNHANGEYARGDVMTNTAESFFSLIKRGVYGTFHHVSKQHLHRYCDEFGFRWTARKVTDSERRDKAIMQTEGKRLFYRQPAGEA